jgi:hypothetical protein
VKNFASKHYNKHYYQELSDSYNKFPVVSVRLETVIEKLQNELHVDVLAVAVFQQDEVKQGGKSKAVDHKHYHRPKHVWRLPSCTTFNRTNKIISKV